jgi:hypothetical protein
MSEAETINEKYVKDSCKIFKIFLGKLGRILEKTALVRNAEISVLYVQKPLKLKDGIYARGLVRIGGSEFPFEAVFSLESETITLESPIFLLRFRLPLKLFEEALD